MRFEAKRFEQMDYMIRYPNGFREGVRYPVIVNIHGAGTRGQVIDQMTEQCCYRSTAEMQDFPFVMVAPLSYTNTWFDMYETLVRFVKRIYNETYCDPTRFYLMGGSMGGYTVWQLGMSLPEYITAMVPICGGGMPWNIETLKDLPVWAFHCKGDPVVDVSESEKMVNALMNASATEVKFTVYPHNHHDAWTSTYNKAELYEWMLSKVKK